MSAKKQDKPSGSPKRSTKKPVAKPSSSNGKAAAGKPKTRAKKSDSGTPVTHELSKQQVAYAVHQFDSPEKLTERDQKLPVDSFDEPERVYRATLCTWDRGSVLALVPITDELNLTAVAATLGVDHVDQSSASSAKRETGFPPGLVSPVGTKRQIPTIIDTSALDYQTLFITSGELGSVIELSPADLIRVTNARSAPLTHRLS